MTTTGIDKNFVFDFFVGGGIGVALIILQNLFPFIGVIGVPSIAASVAGDVGRFIIIVFVASIAETVFFQEFILDFFDNKLKNFGLDLSFFIAAVISSLLFALFHFAAYSGSLGAAGGSFLTAGTMGLLFCYERKWFKSLLPAMVTHAVLNFWILTKLSIVL